MWLSRAQHAKHGIIAVASPNKHMELEHGVVAVQLLNCVQNFSKSSTFDCARKCGFAQVVMKVCHDMRPSTSHHAGASLEVGTARTHRDVSIQVASLEH